MNKAFSLVELSIVLVILGLLTGGILTGQSLIRAAELRSVVTEFKNYQVAMQTFRDKYFALPGDMRNATDFWGIAGGTTGQDSTCYGTASTDKKTCNGNGDGMIGTTSSVTQVHERFRFWQHLANAGLIEGTYTGAAGPLGAQHAVVGTNTPTSRSGGGNGWYTKYSDVNGNYMGVGITASTNSSLAPARLSAEEVWNIDKKMDDGLPRTGKIFVYPDAAPCTDGAGAYLLTDTTKDCTIYFFY
ncbi:MAG: hypothetical protein CMM93_05390 [Rickettsiales bacterium]|nr:hypothetical protein [Rickettsiales bacterium]|tara:strand:+ start:574 stop:1305 length:732 start_codon:yes stop_codon:yes gene_type:complete